MRREISPARLAMLAGRAVIFLGAARIELRSITPHGVLERNQQAVETALRRPRLRDPAEIQRACEEAAFVIRRMATRVPWRSDCLVQALAGQRWLARRGIACTIVVGTAKEPAGGFLFHAWLRHNGAVLLGGDVARFSALLESSQF